MSSETPVSEEVRLKNRRSLIIMFSVGIVPMIFAWTVYFYFPEYMPELKTNQGELIMPPVEGLDISERLPTKKWTLLIPLPGHCDDSCMERFYLSRQVNVALGKESDRVQRAVLVATNSDAQIAEIRTEYPELIVVPYLAGELNQRFEGSGLDAEHGNLVFLMDPHGNIMMSYSVEKLGKGMLKDLKHLLKVSSIG